ncbi:MAG: hypothetical protein HYV09_23755 [Deltaproteobacteria bacterium]|nr:hypothetical protein [Deltaproteobacteria bacterium]
MAFLVGAAGCGGSDDAPPATTDNGADAQAETFAPDAPPDSPSDVSDSAADTTTVDVADATDTPAPTCVQPEGSGTAATHKLVDGSDEATVTVSGDPCKRTFSLKTTAALRDSLPTNPRTYGELDGRPRVRTRNELFDALYALAQDEAREDSVAAISDGSFDDGKPMTCPTGGCFETGRLWKYVWTRDTSYAVDLGLAAVDPTRARNSLEFKLSERRGGGDLQIVQDTGSGGSYPVSTDRVVWAIGATRLLEWLDGAERTAFRDKAYDAIKNTIEHDRQVVFDPVTGLYGGEQSFLDWREQTYPSWTASDTVHLGMSKALSTNVAHLAILRAAVRLGSEKGDTASASKYQTWATQLSGNIYSKMWLLKHKRLSTFFTTTLDPSPVTRFDALGTALAVLHGVLPAADAKDAVATYPHVARGVPVIWPQQKDTKIYHNRSTWPFVTAYFARAARAVRNDAAVENAVWSLMRGAALNLSNMENFEMVSGKAWVDDGAYSGPEVNSQRQLWSVAGYLSMVHDVVFGMETSSEGIRFAPYVTKKLRNGQFANTDTLVLDGLRYRGKSLTVVVHLPAKGASTDAGAYTVSKVRLNGADAGTGFLAPTGDARVDVDLADGSEAGASIRLVTDTADYKNLFAPRAPSIMSIDGSGANLKITWDRSGETAAEIAFNVYRDGFQVAIDVSGATTTWTDPLATATSPSHCYAVDAYFVGSKNHSQHSPPYCFWGTGAARVTTIGASSFANVGGTGVTNHGKFHYEGWGDPTHTLTVSKFKPTRTGEHLLQVVAGNGAGPINTGITGGLKVVEVLDGTTVVARGYFLMPHLGTWSTWRDSSFVRADLTAGKSYEIVIKHDATSVNMSFFSHFERYTGGTGGKSGAFSRVNIAELKVLARVN